MASISGNVDYKQLKAMQQAFESLLGDVESGVVYDEALKDIGRRHLGTVVSNTPFGIYPRQVTFIAYRGTPKQKLVSFSVTPKLGGTLKKGWVVETQKQAESNKGVPSQAEIDSKVASTPINVKGRIRSMTFYNRVKYFNYVDKGHRVMRNGKQIGWAKPQNIIRNSENSTANIMPRVIEKHMRNALIKRGLA